eukprot:scaffold42805_cov380-Skeletonema_marinoi.AAC.1
MANYNGSLQAVDSHSHSISSCFYTIMANYSGSLQAVDCHSHSVRYDIALESSAGGHLRCLIRSPTTL